jgi:hypothetical protein
MGDDPSGLVILGHRPPASVAAPGIGAVPVPAVAAASGPEVAGRFLEFFLVATPTPRASIAGPADHGVAASGSGRR